VPYFVCTAISTACTTECVTRWTLSWCVWDLNIEFGSCAMSLFGTFIFLSSINALKNLYRIWRRMYRALILMQGMAAAPTWSRCAWVMHMAFVNGIHCSMTLTSGTGLYLHKLNAARDPHHHRPEYNLYNAAGAAPWSRSITSLSTLIAVQFFLFPIASDRTISIIFSLLKILFVFSCFLIPFNYMSILFNVNNQSKIFFSFWS